MAVDTDQVRARLRADHEETLRAVAECADTVEASWPESVQVDAALISDPLEECLREAETFQTLLELLRTAVTTAGRTVPADPVPAPPYITITSRGPVLRGPTAGGRLVVTIEVFEVRNSPSRPYQRTEEPYRIAIDWMSD